LATNGDRSVPRFTYDRGGLEIISPSVQHEELRHMVALSVEVITEEMNINVRGVGSTTFRREDLQRGFEPMRVFTCRTPHALETKLNSTWRLTRHRMW
jgi:hypothetical protein